MAQVIRAWKTDVRPWDGNITEEVLALDNGQGVYLNPGEEDTWYACIADALAACAGIPYESSSLLAAWAEVPYPPEMPFWGLSHEGDGGKKG